MQGGEVHLETLPVRSSEPLLHPLLRDTAGLLRSAPNCSNSALSYVSGAEWIVLYATSAKHQPKSVSHQRAYRSASAVAFMHASDIGAQPACRAAAASTTALLSPPTPVAESNSEVEQSDPISRSDATEARQLDLQIRPVPGPLYEILFDRRNCLRDTTTQSFSAA